MSLWGNKDEANNAPKFHVASGYGIAANGQTQYGNTTIGIFGVDAAEAQLSNGIHPGWVLRREGSGGRAGRVMQEVLVAGGSMGFDGSVDDDAKYTDIYITINTQPSNVTANANDNITFSVVATSTPTRDLTYQWYDGDDNSVLTGETGSTLTLSLVQLAQNANTYYVNVSSSGANTVQSNTVTLIVQ